VELNLFQGQIGLELGMIRTVNFLRKQVGIEKIIMKEQHILLHAWIHIEAHT
jgi:hypothetical protein